MAVIVNPGELKERLDVYGKVNDGAIDENGFPMEGTEKLYSLRCKKKTVSTKEFISAGKEQSALTYKFICRKRNIDHDMYIKYKQKTFDIVHVHELDDQYAEITATETEEVI